MPQTSPRIAASRAAVGPLALAAVCAGFAGPLADLPPGWKPGAPHELERSFVAPQATTRLAGDVRRLRAPPGTTPWRGNVISMRIEIDNPYLDPADRFFGVMRRMACLADGSVAVAAHAKTQPDGYMKGNPYATGIWRIAPDGTITALGGARHTITEGRHPFCGVALARSGLNTDHVGPLATAADGSLVFPYAPAWGFGRNAAVLRLTPDARLEPVPDDSQTCAAAPALPATQRFKSVDSAARDPQGNTYVWDRGACTLQRVAVDGTTGVVLSPEQACPAGKPENIFRADAMVWDAARGELVAGGDLLWLKSPDADNYSTIWRVRPDGALRRVFLARKTGKTPQQVDGIGGLALDAKGTVYFGAGIAHGSGSQIMRLDESSGRAVPVGGAPAPTGVNHGDGPLRRAHFARVAGLCFAPDGTLFVHEGTSLVRKVTPAGNVTTWAF